MKMKWNPWPWALTAWFIFLIGVCIWFVIKSMGMNHDLVSSDYYAEGLQHDTHQAALARTRNLENPPRIQLDFPQNRLIVFLPSDVKGAVLNLYRPSDARLDLKYALQDGVPSVLSTLDLYPGMWQAKISWQNDGQDYYFQQDLFIQ
jgi:hypothetical protein